MSRHRCGLRGDRLGETDATASRPRRADRNDPVKHESSIEDLSTGFERTFRRVVHSLSTGFLTVLGMVFDADLQDSHSNEWSRAVDFEFLSTVALMSNLSSHLEPPHPVPLKIAGVADQRRLIGIVHFEQ
jgi:hypothetical protein